MSTDALKEALERQKTGNAEEDYIEVISRALGVKREIVTRVLFAANSIDAALLEMNRTPEFRGEEYRQGRDAYNTDLPDLELRKAYRLEMFNGALRVLVARAIRDDKPLRVWTSSIIPKEQAAALCTGCPEQLECLATEMSTPDKCWGSRKSVLDAKPLRMNHDSVEVEMVQPAGKHRLPFAKLHLK